MAAIGQKWNWGNADPFEAYLTTRPPPASQPRSVSTPGKKLWPQGLTRSQVLRDVVHPPKVNTDGRVVDAAVDPFASFTRLRPQVITKTHTDLCEDVLRTKKKLLEAAIQAEVKAQDPSTPSRIAAKLRRIRRAEKYLEDPERTNLVGSDSEDEKAFFDDPTLALPSRAASPSASSAPGKHQETTMELTLDVTAAPSGHQSPSKRPVFQEPEIATDMTDIIEATMKPDATMKRKTVTQSMPDLLKGTQDATVLASGPAEVVDNSPGRKEDNAAGRDVVLPPIDAALGFSASAGALGSTVGTSRTSPPKRKKQPLLSGWWTETRLWNVTVVRKGQLAQRHQLELPGGAVVLGNGRTPLYNGTHLLSPGYFYAFKVVGIDDARFSKGACKDLSIAFGYSRVPASNKECEKPQYAYEIPGVVLVGYGSRVIDGGRWYRHIAEDVWRPKELDLNDEVGVLLTMKGDMVVFLNGKQVLRLETSFAQDLGDVPDAETAGTVAPVDKSRAGAGKSMPDFFPIVDLHGRVSAVQINARRQPPNVPLEHKNRLKLTKL